MRPLLPILALAACTTQGTVTPVQNAAGVPPAPTWSLLVQGCPRTDTCEDLRTAILSRLVASRLAERVVAPFERAQVELTVDVTSTRTIGAQDRVLLGAINGRNTVTGQVTVRDLRRPGNPPGPPQVLRLASASAGFPYSDETRPQDATDRFATDLVNSLQR